MRDFLASVDKREQRTMDFLVELNRRLQHEIRYLIRLEPGVQTPEETLQLAAGSCRDSGWLLVHVLRHLGLAARFVSGYLIQLKPDVQALDGPSGTDHDFTDLHAWCEVFLPGAGWIGFDPTSGLMAGEGHLPVACTPEPTTAAPISGLVDDCKVEFEHTMKVTRIYEAPRVTKPYTDEQWGALDALGHRVDTDLKAMDVRLTQGGEPTFVSVDDRDGAEWNTAALGPTKRRYAMDLLLRLKERYGAQGFLHLGQGKWYPGEQLPRWALSICWRTDGEPCWHDAGLFADEREPASCTAADAERFMRRLAQRLGIDGSFVLPGLRGRLVLPVARATPAVQRRSVRRTTRRRTGARAPGPCVHPGAGQPGGLCAADPSRTVGGRLSALGQQPMVPARRAAVTWCRATHRWDTGCRWIRCPGRNRKTNRSRSSTIPLRPVQRCRCTPTFAPITRRTPSAAASQRVAR